MQKLYKNIKKYNKNSLNYCFTVNGQEARVIVRRGSLLWNPRNIYLFKVNNRNTRKRCEICLKLTIKHQNDVRHRSGVFIVNSEHISDLFLVFLIADFEKVIVCWNRRLKHFCTVRKYLFKSKPCLNLNILP